MTIVSNPKVSYRIDGAWVDALTGVTYPDLGWPNITNVGVAAIPGWAPVATYDYTGTENNLQIFDADSVISDVRVIGGSIIVRAPRVTLRRCEVVNGAIFNDYSDVLGNGLLMEDCTVRCDPPGFKPPVSISIGVAGYTCRRCALIDVYEGWRAGNAAAPLMDPDHPDGYRIKIFDSYCTIVADADCSAASDYHGDCFQAVDDTTWPFGVPITLRNVSMYAQNHIIPDCTASQSIASGSAAGPDHAASGPWDINGVLLGGRYATAYLNDCGGTVRNMYIEDHPQTVILVGSNIPTEEMFARHTVWENVFAVADINEDGSPGEIVGTIPYGYPGYGPLDPPPETPP